MSPQRRPWKPVVTALICALLFTLIILQWSTLHDWWRLRSYHAPAAISQLAAQTTMSSYAKRLFYINRPQVEDKRSFAGACTNRSEHTIVLGCYRGGDSGIYVLRVTDQRLFGVEQVTAAHEMLHAAYARLGSSQRRQVDTMLMHYARVELRDARIKAALKTYEQTEPGQQLNEMHSIFGTEIAQLPADLEAYYKQYFTKRSTVTAYAARYEAAFTSRERTISGYDTQLAQWKRQIHDMISALDRGRTSLNRRSQQLDQDKAAGRFDAYNAALPAYNAEVTNYNTQVANLKALITRYNGLVKTRNAVALEQNQLYNAIDSSQVPRQK